MNLRVFAIFCLERRSFYALCKRTIFDRILHSFFLLFFQGDPKNVRKEKVMVRRLNLMEFEPMEIDPSTHSFSRYVKL